MKKIIIYTCVILCTNLAGFSQINLVKNPSFEHYHQCPYTYDQIIFANSWSPIHDTVPYIFDTFGTNPCSPEYCNACSAAGVIGVPYGGYYYHYAINYNHYR